MLTGNGTFQLLFRGWNFIDQLGQDHVAHGETDRGERERPVAQLMDQIVVPAAAGEGSKFAAAIERFKNNPCVISEPANNPKVDLDELSETSEPKRIDDPIEFLAPTFAIEN